SILFRRLISEARWKGYCRLRITTGAENHAMRALAAKFGANLVFAHGESAGTIDVPPPQQAQLARLAIDAQLAAARAVMNFNRACWKLFSRMYGTGRAA
ncbi:MAG TPA: GNAT family N-acetyltransferase, partial [Bradyrhizobium sp.]|nr:GNAT family N-acetyltransferase [Bradyrhizobium sp.]